MTPQVSAPTGARMRRPWQPEAAEAVGTFALVLLGGAAIQAGLSAPLVALAFGGAVMVMVYALGHVSGAHFNPAVTLGFAATGHFPWRRVPGYVAAQAAGALMAVLALRALGPVDGLIASGTQSGPTAVAVEAVATAILALVIIAVATDERAAPAVAGLAIGATVFLCALVAGPLTGAAMNPARALAPAVVTGQWGGLAGHVLGPALGGLLGMLAYQGLRRGARPAQDEALGALGPVDLEAKA